MNKTLKIAITVLTLIAAVASYPISMPLIADSSPTAINAITSIIFCALAAVMMYSYKGSKKITTVFLVYWSLLLLSAILVVLSIDADITLPVMMIFAIITLPPIFGIPVIFGAVNAAYMITLLLIPLAFLIYAIVLKKRQKQVIAVD